MTHIERRATTIDNPLIIANPSLAFVNLAGNAGKSLMEQDRKYLGGIFRDNIQVADGTPPKCDVLFLYCALEASGRAVGASNGFRELIREAGADIAVIASEIPPPQLSDAEFTKGLQVRSDWPANIVITLNRNGEHFGGFFHQLFSQMLDGTTTPMAWVDLAPQGPHQPVDIPETICLMEAGHIAFGAERSA